MDFSCAICQELFDTTLGIITTKCGHVFHSKCIEQWFQQADTCPQCRSHVDKTNLTKLYFNTSLGDIPDCPYPPVEKFCKIILDQIKAKDEQIISRNKTIQELDTRYYNGLVHVHNKVCSIEKELQRLNVIKYNYEELIEEHTILHCDLQDILTNVKEIAESCSRKAKKKLHMQRAHIYNAKGKVATHATYCSIIKEELASSVQAKTQLQNELTKMKWEMNTLQTNYTEKIRQLEQQVKKLNNINSSHQNVPGDPGPITVDSVKNYPPQWSNCQLKQQVKRLNDINSSHQSVPCDPGSVAVDSLENSTQQWSNLANSSAEFNHNCENQVTATTDDFVEDPFLVFGEKIDPKDPSRFIQSLRSLKYPSF